MIMHNKERALSLPQQPFLYDIWQIARLTSLSQLRTVPLTKDLMKPHGQQGSVSVPVGQEYTHQKSLATLDGKIADSEITVKLKMRDALQVHDEQT